MSVDHKGSTKEEITRIQSIGGFVTEKGRVMGDLAVARSLGDCNLSPYVSYKPYINEISLTNDDEFLIVCCDGVFDVFEDQEVVDFVLAAPRDLSAAMLRDYAYMAGSSDNISAVVVYLKHP